VGINAVTITGAEFGGKNVEMIPISDIVNLQQMRAKIDLEGVKNLRMRILQKGVTPEGIAIYDLVHPIMVNRLDRAHLTQFLADYADYYEGDIEEIDIEKLPWRPDGTVDFRVLGHMRGLAQEMDCEELEIPLSAAKTAATVKYNMDFKEFRQKQNIENTTVHVDPIDDAIEIEREYKWRKRHHKDTSYVAIAKYFGYGEGKIHDALRFRTAPEAIVRFVDKGLSYTNIVDLVRLREAHEKHLRYKYTLSREQDKLERVPEEAAQKMMGYFEIKLYKILRGKRAGYISEMIQARIKEVDSWSMSHSDPMFDADVDEAELETRRRLRPAIAQAAIEALGYLYADGSLTDEQLNGLLGTLSERMASIAAERASMREADAARAAADAAYMNEQDLFADLDSGE
jgi:hypothetical protein